MTDTGIYDLLDEVNCAVTCEAIITFCGLVDELLEDIQHLELECISTRISNFEKCDEIENWIAIFIKFCYNPFMTDENSVICFPPAVFFRFLLTASRKGYGWKTE